MNPTPRSPTDSAASDPAVDVAGRPAIGGSPAPMKLRQPAGLRVLFMTEMWERFSFYGMKALLVVFLITVVSASTLTPGVYRTSVEFKDKSNNSSQTFEHKIVVGQNQPADAPAPPPPGSALKIVPSGPALTHGPAGGPFENPTVEYSMTNTGSKPIEYSVSISRDKAEPFVATINDGTSPITGKLEPGETAKVALAVNTGQGGRGWAKSASGNLMSWYTGLVYLTPLIGGFLADRYLGTHRCLLIGGAIIALGHFTLMADTLPSLYAGLVLVVIGTGFFKSNVSTMVGQLYSEGDPRRDAGFTIFYMGINLGAFIAPLICAWLRAKYGWSWGFGAAGVGMTFGLIQYSLGKRKYLPDIGNVASAKAARSSGAPRVPLTPEERSRIAVIFIMAFFVIFFWTAYEQASNSMAYFGQERTDRWLPSWLKWAGDKDGFPNEWFQSVNPLMILLLAPVFASLWVRLARMHREPSTIFKMAIGLVTLGLGFIFMVVGAQASSGGVKVSPFWLLAAFFVHTCAELCLSPVGLSLVTKLAPIQFASLLMGTWFLANFIANFVAARLAGQVDRIAESGFILPGWAGFFLIFVIAPVAAGAVLMLLVPTLKKMVHGRA